jgi:hypothetical protein
MARLVPYFGDTEDDAPCGQCDGCRPQECAGRRFRPATAAELDLANKTLEALAGAKPSSNAEPLRIKGIGPKLAEKRGAELLGIVRG